MTTSHTHGTRWKMTRRGSRIGDGRMYALGNALRLRLCRAGFTLIELLVVCAVFAILSSLLLPALRKAISTAGDVKCLSNQHQANVADQLWADDHFDRFVTGEPYTMTKDRGGDGGYSGYQSWYLTYPWLWLGAEGYVAAPEIFTCPRGVSPVPFAEYLPSHANWKPLIWGGGDFVNLCRSYIYNDDSAPLDKEFGASSRKTL